jgi:hypothetical protein
MTIISIHPGYLLMAITMATTGFLVANSAVVDQDPVEVSDGGQVLSFNERELKKSEESKKSKGAKKAKKGSGYASTTIEDIEGVYHYQGCDNNVFQATIICGIFGDDDPDLCIYQEFKVGEVSEENGLDAADVGDGSYFQPDPILDVETTSPDDACIFSGTFRASAALEGNKILSIPLATSNGCQKVEQNFLYTVKMEVYDDGSLKLDFSNDGGFTYYTQEGEQCPLTYKGIKYWEMEELVARSAEVGVCSDEGRFLKHGRRLCPPCAAVVVAQLATAGLASTASVLTICNFLCLASF